MTLDEITATDWSTSIAEPGEVVTDLEDIKQCLHILLMSRKGTAPFRPFFGCDWFDRLDQPMTVAAPQMVNDVRYAIQKWEPRVIIKEIVFKFAAIEGAIYFRLDWEPIAGTRPGQENTMVFKVKQGVIYLVNEFNQFIETEFGIITF